MKKKKNICFAYYVDDKFTGWYADSFGSIRNIPKVYSKSKHQLDVIKKNFFSKMKDIKNNKKEEDYFLNLIYKEALVDKDKIGSFNKVELRIVKFPYYQGKNPNFSRKIQDKFNKNYTKLYHKWCKEMNLDAGIKKGTIFGIALIDNYQIFEKVYPTLKPVSYIYVDFEKLKSWSSKEPTKTKKFLTFKNEK